MGDYSDMVLFCKRCPQQRPICQALLYPNSGGNTSAFRFQIAPQIPATHHLTLPLVLNLIFPLMRVTILVVLAFQTLVQLRPTQSTRSAHQSSHPEVSFFFCYGEKRLLQTQWSRKCCETCSIKIRKQEKPKWKVDQLLRKELTYIHSNLKVNHHLEMLKWSR